MKIVSTKVSIPDTAVLEFTRAELELLAVYVFRTGGDPTSGGRSIAVGIEEIIYKLGFDAERIRDTEAYQKLSSKSHFYFED